MSSFSFADLLEAAEKGGSAGRVELSPGIYTLEYVSGTRNTTKAGKPRFTVKWKVMRGPEKGSTVYDDYYFSGIGPALLKMNLLGLGATIEDLENEPTDDELNDKLSNTVADVEVTHSQGTSSLFINFKVLGKPETVSAPSSEFKFNALS